MTPGAEDRNERARRATRVLRELGVAGVVEAAGKAGEIATIRAPHAHVDALLGEAGREVGARMRELGFRYVALDLEGDEESVVSRAPEDAP